MPPTRGAMIGASPITAEMNESAIAAGSGSKESRTIAREITVATEAPIACRKRAITKPNSDVSTLASRLASANKVKPPKITGRRP